MRKLNILGLALMTGVLSLTCTACSTTVADNTESYFSNVSSILKTLFSSSSTSTDEASETTTDSDTVKLDAPSNFSIDEDGNYSFTGVDGADYYLLYFCDMDATEDTDTFIYSSEPIYDDGSETYSGQASDSFQYGYGEYLVKVFAFPSISDSEHSMSTAATGTYTYTGEQSAPELYYYWNTFEETMGVQIANMDSYLYEAYPDQVDITFTNVSDSSDTITLTIEEVSDDNYGVTTDALTKGETYEVTAVATSTNEFVTNPTSDTTTIEGLTLGDSHLFTFGYSYSDGFANDIFNWPVLVEDFDLENGGSAGSAATNFGTTSFTVTPADSITAGSSYSYTLQAGSWAEGILELYSDGTFLADETGGGPVNASYISGTWYDNGDGTATLNYDHSTIVIN